MKQALKDMLGSKKATAMIVGLVVGLGGKYGLDLPPEELTAILSPVLAYIYRSWGQVTCRSFSDSTWTA